MRTAKLYPAGDHWRWWCRECQAECELADGLEDVEEVLECDICGERHQNFGPVSDPETRRT